ncbi:MAG: NAD(P)-dependent oxidoreductase [Candidatus Rokubacteria bacterium]|nr:NAD(P)-dependent oxidoreductase [Candidatus Rokubacteria bacterium]
MREGGRVALLGAGRMGGAMVGTLRRAGFDVTVWNRSRERAEAVAAPVEARVARSAQEAVAGAEVVLSSLADDLAVKDVYTGAAGAAAALAAGTVVLETSTIAPQTVHAIRPAIEARGAALLDAPVSGSVALVEAGQLTIMVGGEAPVLERARPVLAALSARLFHVGALGSGATVKLAVNALVHAINVALSEALVLAEKAGVARSAAYDVFAAGAGAAPFVLYKRAAFERPDETPVTFRLDLAAKDLDLILALAAQVGARMDQATVNRATAGAAIAAGLGSRDASAIATFLRSQGRG